MSLSKKNKLVLFLFTILLIASYTAYKYIYKPHKPIAEKAVAFSGSTDSFLEIVKTDVVKWQDVVVELTGTITLIDTKGIMLNNNNIYCQLEDRTAITNLQKGQTLTIKARMIGYDDLLEEIKLDQTIIK
ncbi:hypothetical protein [Maribacter ulvicola]|uniref:tRNA_anti-like n=1 Tax=Maribacter ulvicola TaxID=228959 RepID=A0A1N6V7D2_9FLAO|nr:hypothetical protein [Maribacter ulvicola]SIQ73804.1 hypothetical protein SAMN05421797_10322 [Maribacter ulvicola]